MSTDRTPYPTVPQLLEAFSAVGFEIEPAPYPEAPHEDRVSHETWMHRSEWQRGAKGRPGWPVNGLRAVIPHEVGEPVEVHAFDRFGVHTGLIRLTGSFVTDPTAFQAVLEALPEP